MQRLGILAVIWVFGAQNLCRAVTIHTNLESTLPTPDEATTFNTPSPINVPPTSSSTNLPVNSAKSSLRRPLQTSSEMTVAMTTTDLPVTTSADLMSENNTFNSLRPTELPTEPVQPERKVILVTTKKSPDEPDFVRIRIPGGLFLQDVALPKQIPAVTTDPVEVLLNRAPCTCDEGVCKCCMFAVLGSKGCAMIRYIPEDFSFDFRLMMNNNVLYKRKVSGKNPPPICIHPRRFPFQLVEVCANFYDIYFVGRNMHMCLEVTGNFNGYDVFNRNFECLHFGTSGLGVASAGDNSNLPTYGGGGGGVDADVDANPNEEIEDYDENARKAD